MTDSPLTAALLGSTVMALSAESSRCRMGALLAPQLSEPTHRKWPTCCARLLALRSPLQSDRRITVSV